MNCLIQEEPHEEGGKQVVDQTVGLDVSIVHVAITDRSPCMDDAVEDPVVNYWRFVTGLGRAAQEVASPFDPPQRPLRLRPHLSFNPHRFSTFANSSLTLAGKRWLTFIAVCAFS